MKLFSTQISKEEKLGEWRNAEKKERTNTQLLAFSKNVNFGNKTEFRHELMKKVGDTYWFREWYLEPGLPDGLFSNQKCQFG
jgi:hypothetical protein